MEKLELIILLTPIYLMILWMVFRILDFKETLDHVKKICYEVKIYEEKKYEEYEEIRKRLAIIEHVVIRWNTERGIIQKLLGNGPHTIKLIKRENKNGKIS